MWQSFQGTKLDTSTAPMNTYFSRDKLEGNILNKKWNAHFVDGITFCITQQWGAGKLPPSQALFILTTLIVYALDHIGAARHGLGTLHEIDSEWDISLVGLN